MAYNSNTSHFVKTYGKQRHTQRLVQDLLWYENITDDFDKCLGIEDVQKTTFISPEPAGSVTVNSYTKHKTKTKNKMNTIGKWSMHLQSTLSGHKSKTIKNRNFEYSSYDCYNKKNLLLENTGKKKTDYNCRKIYSNSSSTLSTDSSIVSNLKVKSTTIKKSNKKFILPRDQCSTPFQRTIFTHRKQLNHISSIKKKKKNKSKINFICTLNDSYSPTLSKKPEYSCLNSSNLKVKEVKKYNQLEESVLISGSHCLLPSKKQQNSKHKSIQSTIGNSHRKHNSQVLKKPCKSSSYKKNKIFNNSKEKNSNWYKDVMTIFNEEKVINLEKSLEKNNFESVIINYKTTNVLTKPLENLKESSPSLNVNNKLLQPTKYTNKSSSEEDDHDSIVDFNKSKKHNSYKNNIVKIKDKTIIEKSKPDEIYDEDSSNLFNDSLYVSCYELTKDKVTEHIESPKIPCINSINVSVDGKLLVDKSSITNSKSPQQNQISSYKNSLLNSLCNNMNESCTNSLNIKSLNILEQNTSNKSSYFNQSLHTSINENLSLRSSSNESVKTAYKYNPQIFLDVTEKFSNITIDDKVERYDELSNISLNKSSFNNSVSNNSSLILHSSSASKLDTIIYKQNHSNVFFKDNSDYLSLNKKDVDFLKAPCVRYSINNNLKCNDMYNDTNSSNNKIIILNKDNNVLCNNSQNEIFNSSSSYITTKEKLPSNCNETSGLSNESKNIYSDFEDISCIKYEEQTTTENPANMYNNTFDEKFEETTNTQNFSQNISRRKRYAERFQNININSVEEYDHQDSNVEIQNSTHKYLDYTQSISSHQNVSSFRLEPGKKWRRSILIVRNYIDGNLDQTTDFASNAAKGRKWISTVDDVLRQQSINNSMYQKCDQGNIFRNSMCYASERYLKNKFTENELAKKSIFEICNQEELISFESWLELKVKKPWKKVGEGVYGEVFSYAYGKNNTVVKIIPIEGETKINSERQKKMFEVYSEILIATKLNKLFDNNGWNYTKSFCKLKSISCVHGKYPKHLISLWSEYNNNKGSDNDNPNILPDTQMFMVLEMEDGGIDVETFLFNSASQALFAFLQIVFGLAVAEQQYNFEHRDLHIGNILVKKISSKTPISYKLDGEVFHIPSHGVKMTIIDFTLSRMTHYSKPIYNDLAEDPEIFASDGDYQFEIYRLMRKETNDEWSSYKPKTNIYWLHYVLDKMLTSVHYRKVSTAVHHIGLNNLLKIKNSILLFDSAKHFSQSNLILDLIN